MKVLIADDDATTRLVLCRTLSRFGYEAEVARDGSEAWQLLQEHQGPQIAVLDWNMPGRSGIELCHLLRRQAGTRYVYVILLTARSGREDLVAGLAAGADEFLAKPVEPEELGARLRTAQRIVDLQVQNERSRSYLSAILSTIDSGILLSDPQDRVVYANEALAQMSGVSTAETVDARRDKFAWSTLGAADPTGPLAPGPQNAGRVVRDFELSSPPRVFRQTSALVVLPDGVGTLDVYRDITAEVEHGRQMARIASTDALTGLANRRAAEESMRREVARARRSGAPLSFALFDVDHFKRVNDTYGHATGDLVLQLIASNLMASVRLTDVVARWGGEEFLLLLSGTGADGARTLAKRILERVEAARSANLPSVTVSAGVAELLPEDSTGADVLRRADEQLYDAKRSGRNRVS
ncbi:MAG: Response regulator PleD [Pseudomonadota bacterium]|jgi:diguanylate cyclase (GGDEF)-like protein